MGYLYQFGIGLYMLFMRIAALFSAKADLWVRGRKNWRQQMAGAAYDDASVRNNIRTIWFHCASLGEFEQGRPVLEAFRERNPDWRILLTFFSPSGYEYRKHYEHAYHVCYLPMDSLPNVRKFLDIWNPEIAVFVKYEFWFNYLRELAARRVKLFVISAVFRKKQHFFRFYGYWFRKQLRHVTRFFVQDEASRHLLANYGITNVKVSGDTRFDRVYALAQEEHAIPGIETFVRGNKILVAGSTWPKDERLLKGLLKSMPQNLRVIVAPHEVSDDKINRLMQQAGPSACLYSSFSDAENDGCRVMIIDRIGLLSRLYRYGDIAYIGGGFGEGIHNILEAATYGIPVVFGPNHGKFVEARELISGGGAFCIRDQQELNDLFLLLMNDESMRKKAGSVCKEYVEKKQGAVKMIMQDLGEASMKNTGPSSK
ncbi:MAG: 3-deoxy-D-manno-octulosonic acid transferase [Bacteroidia bacterium]|nr:MAG: 3-deoxy-D-manno-octulosonic acid transferase [Bacteroidia bacterium]